MSNSSTSALFDGWWPFIFLLIMFQGVSVRSDLEIWADHDRVSSSIHTLIILAVWHWALSLEPILRVVEHSQCRRKQIIFFGITLYTVWLDLLHPSQRQICLTPALLKKSSRPLSLFLISQCKWVQVHSTHKTTRCWSKVKTWLLKEDDIRRLLFILSLYIFGPSSRNLF